MKLLLSDEEMVTAVNKQRGLAESAGLKVWDEDNYVAVAKAQLNHIFNLDAKTTSEVIVKLEAHLDKLYLKEMAK